MRPAGFPPIVTSKKTFGLLLFLLDDEPIFNLEEFKREVLLAAADDEVEMDLREDDILIKNIFFLQNFI